MAASESLEDSSNKDEETDRDDASNASSGASQDEETKAREDERASETSSIEKTDAAAAAAAAATVTESHQVAETEDDPPVTTATESSPPPETSHPPSVGGDDGDAAASLVPESTAAAETEPHEPGENDKGSHTTASLQPKVSNPNDDNPSTPESPSHSVATDHGENDDGDSPTTAKAPSEASNPSVDHSAVATDAVVSTDIETKPEASNPSSMDDSSKSESHSQERAKDSVVAADREKEPEASNPSMDDNPESQNHAVATVPAVSTEDDDLETGGSVVGSSSNSTESPGKQQDPPPSNRTKLVLVVATLLLVTIGAVLGVLLSRNRSPPDELPPTDYLQAAMELTPSPPESFVPEFPVVSTAFEDRTNALAWLVKTDGGLERLWPDRGGSVGVRRPFEAAIDPDVLYKFRQRYVLALLYFATNGDQWEDDFGFLSSADECEWRSSSSNDAKGVICNADGSVAQIRLWWNNLSGTLPAELSFFNETLSELNVGGGSLGGSLPDTFRSLTHLRGLAVNDHCLTGVIPQEVLELASLEVLALSNTFVAVPTETSLDRAVCDPETSGDYRSGFSAAVVDASLGCTCCLSCDPNEFRCGDTLGDSSNNNIGFVTSVAIHEVTKDGYVKQFEKECLTEEQTEWIRTECPCVMPHTSQDNAWQCTNSCDDTDARRSHSWN